MNSSVLNKKTFGETNYNDDASDADNLYILKTVSAHPTGVRVVHINQDTCGCVMSCSVKDGTKRKSVCTKPRDLCSRRTQTHRDARSVNGDGLLLVEMDPGSFL